MVRNIAIVEDDDKSAEILLEYLKRYEKESGEVFNVTRFSDGDEITYEYSAKFSIIFLDIQMKRMDGMSAAEYIRTMDKDVIIIFVTKMAQYAVKGYSVNALDFLLKPVSYFVFSQQLKRSIEQLKRRDVCDMLFPTKNGAVKIDVSQIMYIESFSHKMIAYELEKQYDFSGTMWQLENQLASKNFCRCNNSYLVNLAYVNNVCNNEVTVGKVQLPISRSRKKKFMEELARYCGGMNNESK